MPKYLAIFAVVLSLAVFVAIRDERAAERGTQIAACQNSSTAAVKADKNQPQKDIPNPITAFPEWITPFFRWPNGTTAWAIILTLFAIAEQTRHTAKAAEATGESVKAIRIQSGHLQTQTEQAKRQVDLMREQMDTQVEKERARLNLEVLPIEIFESGFDDGVNLVCCIELTNSGHSNAFIKFGAARLVLSSSRQQPLSEADPDDFSPGSKTIEPSKEPIYCPIQSEDIPLRIRDFCEDMANSTRKLYLYGFVKYETLGIRWHRDFGYVWKVAEPARVPPDPESVVFSRPGAPDRLCLTGWWEQNLNQKNSEYRE
jgi:hypothetical protein